MVHRSVVSSIPIRRIAQFAALLAGLLLPGLLRAQTTASLTPASFNFGNQVENTTSSAEVFTLKNTGAHQLTGISISITGAFAQTHTCGTTLNSGKTCTISVTFTPHSVGSVSQRMNIQDVDPTSPQVVTLGGTGLAAPDVQVSPTFLGYGGLKVGTTATKTVALNNQGSASLTISSVTISGANGKDFTETNNCGSSLAAGKACTVTVVFKPSATGNRAGILSIYDNDSDSSSPQSVSLAGLGK